MPTPIASYTCKLTPPQAESLRAWMNDQQFQWRQVPYARFAGEKDKVNLVFYESGKLVVQGKGTSDFVEFVLEPLVLKEAKLGYEDQLNPDRLLPRLGIDESGKGDFFGPLCVAGVYINAEVARAWDVKGVRDSKHIGSDRRIAQLADMIRKTPGCVTAEVTIGNEAYNRLYAKMRSVNAILAWGHARVIENLLLKQYQMRPPPVRAISDQFAASHSTVTDALMSLGRNIELIQRHRAEDDLAVAAASILARQDFVSRLQKLGADWNMTLPKGASAAVDEAAQAIVRERGVEALKKVAKMHFRTAYRAQGLPEPPKKPWRRQ